MVHGHRNCYQHVQLDKGIIQYFIMIFSWVRIHEISPNHQSEKQHYTLDTYDQV